MERSSEYRSAHCANRGSNSPTWIPGTLVSAKFERGLGLAVKCLEMTLSPPQPDENDRRAFVGSRRTLGSTPQQIGQRQRRESLQSRPQYLPSGRDLWHRSHRNFPSGGSGAEWDSITQVQSDRIVMSARDQCAVQTR